MSKRTKPPRSYLWLFIGILVLAELLLVGVDLFYLFGQDGTVGEFLFDVALITVITVGLVLLTYFTIRRTLVRYMDSERRFRELADLLPEGLVEVDSEGKVTYANDLALRWFGYTSHDIAAGAVNVFNIISPDEVQRASENMSAVSRGEVLSPRMYEAVRSDGTRLPVLISSSRIERSGQMEGVRAVITDMTEQKRIEGLIRESEKKYRELADSLPEVVFEMDTDGTITYANARANEVFGYADEVPTGGVNLRRLVPDPDEAVADMRAMVETRTMHASKEYVAMRKGGATFPAIVSASLVMEAGEPTGIRGILTDISQMKEAQQRIRQSEAKYRQLFESSIDGILVVSLATGMITDANEAFLKMIGYPLEELRKKVYADLTPERWHEMEMKIIREQVMERDYSEEYEKEITREDGKVIPVSVRRWLIKDEDSRPIGMWSILRDITEKKRREEEIARANAELLSYAETVSHDLKGPIHEVTMAGETVQLLLGMPRSDETAEYMNQSFEVLQHGLSRANTLIDDMLVLAESGQIPRELESVRVSDKVAEVLAERAADIEIRNIDVRVDDDLGVLVASPTHVYQIFSNLIKNAITYGDSLEPVIEIRLLEPAEDGAHRYLVRDNGPGIPENLIEGIFVPFAKGKGGHTGIGLSIVQRLAEVYDGRISVKNDGGACFELVLHDYAERIQA